MNFQRAISLLRTTCNDAGLKRAAAWFVLTDEHATPEDRDVAMAVLETLNGVGG